MDTMLCWLSMLYFVTGWIHSSAKILQHEKAWPLEKMNENSCTRILCPTRQNVCLKVSSVLRTSPTKSFTMDIKDCDGSFMLCLPDVALNIVADAFCSNNSKSHKHILRQKRHARRQSGNETQEEQGQSDECQTTCVADKEMVCGFNAYHIYKTFLSMCHMKAYNCLYPKENMELAIRKGCLLSSPVSVGTVLKRPAEEDITFVKPAIPKEEPEHDSAD